MELTKYIFRSQIDAVCIDFENLGAW